MKLNPLGQLTASFIHLTRVLNGCLHKSMQNTVVKGLRFRKYVQFPYQENPFGLSQKSGSLEEPFLKNRSNS